MGVNSHILPGDLVVAISGQENLYAEYSEELFVHGFASHIDDQWCLLDTQPCLVLGMRPAGSSKGGHAFCVLTSQLKIGWVWNYSVVPVASQRAPEGA